MIKKICTVLLIGNVIWAVAFGGVTGVSTSNQPVVDPITLKDEGAGSWQILAGMGYTNYNDAFSSDGATAAGRFALNFSPIHLAWRDLKLGLEMGVQSGNKMRLSLPQDTVDQMGGTSIQSTIKPIIDLLGTLQISLNGANTVYLILKGGAAYRQWQFDRDTIKNKDQISGELQVGLGLKVSRQVKLVGYYQGIYGKNMKFSAKSGGNGVAGANGSVGNVPAQHGGFLGVEVML